jgi:hypothetical protein
VHAFRCDNHCHCLKFGLSRNQPTSNGDSTGFLIRRHAAARWPVAPLPCRLGRACLRLPLSVQSPLVLVHYLTSAGSALRKDFGEGFDGSSSSNLPNSHELHGSHASGSVRPARRTFAHTGSPTTCLGAASPPWLDPQRAGRLDAFSLSFDRQHARVRICGLQVPAPRLQSVSAILDANASRARMSKASLGSASESVDHSRPTGPPKQVPRCAVVCSTVSAVHLEPSVGPVGLAWVRLWVHAARWWQLIQRTRDLTSLDAKRSWVT